MPYRRVQILLEPEQDDELEHQSRALGRSKSDLVREKVRLWLARHDLRATDAVAAMPPVHAGPAAPTEVSSNVDHF